MEDTQKIDPRMFGFGPRFSDPFRQAISNVIQGSMEGLLAWRWLREAYAKLEDVNDATEFLKCALEALGVSVQLDQRDAERFPVRGPLLVVANHPFGGLDGIVLAWILKELRSDVKVIANSILAGIPQLKECFLPVSPFGEASSVGGNATGLRQALRFLEAGGAVVVFPAGEVAHFDFKSFQVADPPWRSSVAFLARKSHAPVVPVYFTGHNGLLFQLAGLIHPSLRTALLPRELANKRSRTVEVRVGEVISTQRLSTFPNDEEVTTFLRERTHHLGLRGLDQRMHAPFQQPPIPTPLEPLIEAVSPDDLDAEVGALPTSQILVESGECLVCYAHAQQIPNVLREIGRLREKTFREVGEGTGKALDLDAFDSDYLHLFVWHGTKREIVGSYRLNKTNFPSSRRDISRRFYTSTLFEFQSEFFRSLGPALELGRSFVQLSYQRSSIGLPLLWKGIGRFIASHPEYKMLFGPVSMSKEYQIASRSLVVDYLRENRGLHPWVEYVRPRSPFRHTFGRRPRIKVLSVFELDDLSTLIADIEPDHKGVPILLKQYLKLGGQALGFNVDAEFSDVLDVLILVDLTATDPRVLERYMGREGAADFLNYHRVAKAS